MAEQKESKSDCLDYAQWAYARVNQIVRETMSVAAGSPLIALPSFCNQPAMHGMEQRIDAAVDAEHFSLLTVLCIEYEDRMSDYCDHILKQSAQKAKGAAAQ